ncbi:MAG: hypothetical protein ACRDCC_08345 [Culicoidibacterales bacterium]
MEQKSLIEYIEDKIPNLQIDLKFNELENYIINCAERAWDIGSFYDVALGCSHLEHKADEYFTDANQNYGEVYTMFDNLFVVETEQEVFFFDNEADFTEFEETNQDTYILTKFPAVYYVAIVEQDDLSQGYIFENREEAIAFVDSKAEDVAFPTIQTEIDYFENALSSDIAYRTTIEVNKEMNNDGYFHSYNIYFNDNLFEDGIFKLDAEAFEAEIQSLFQLEKTFENENIKIANITKQTHNFDRTYELTCAKEYTHQGEEYQISTIVEIPIVGMQGQSRNVADFILKQLDMDALKNELDELFQDEITDPQSLYSFCGVNENEVEKSSQERE